MNCITENVEGIVRCKACRRPMPVKYPNAKRTCGASPGGQDIPKEIYAAIEVQAESHGMLVGDAIAAMTKAVGIQPCVRCERWRQYLNKAHAWIASYFSPKS